MLYSFTQVQFSGPTLSLLSKNPEEKRSCVLSLNNYLYPGQHMCIL